MRNLKKISRIELKIVNGGLFLQPSGLEMCAWS
ncbi:bacteriocin-like protein [Chryseobacterium populi]|uniref:Uncharacterized protein n=1 Tax=Chryseobacterium populi TaxID=1144316 RepID=J2STN2_9FLAO|nr:hypothetical protein PMI13_03424 [Chryseobacterium populi]